MKVEGRRIAVFCDGLCEPTNPEGIACYGYVIYEGGRKLAEGCGVVDRPNPSNNVAEYSACIHALNWLIENDLTSASITVQSDSQLLIRQLSGYYRVKAPRIISIYKEARELAKQFRKIRFRWVPREMNEEADGLSRKAYAEHVSKQLDSFLEKYKRYLATERQKALLDKLKIRYPPWISRREASRLISQFLGRGY